MHITMVIKVLKDGRPCPRCEKALEFLEVQGMKQHIDRIVAVEAETPMSEGILLAEKFGATRAPFFVIRQDSGREVFCDSPFLLRRELAHQLRPETEGKKLRQAFSRTG
jgi:hypothetical protein